MILLLCAFVQHYHNRANVWQKLMSVPFSRQHHLGWKSWKPSDHSLHTQEDLCPTQDNRAQCQCQENLGRDCCRPSTQDFSTHCHYSVRLQSLQHGLSLNVYWWWQICDCEPHPQSNLIASVSADQTTFKDERHFKYSNLKFVSCSTTTEWCVRSFGIVCGPFQIT